MKAISFILLFLISGIAIGHLPDIRKEVKTDLDHFNTMGFPEGNAPIIPCGSKGSSDEFIREIGNVVFDASESIYKYRITYTGYSEDLPQRIHYAYSEDGIHWTKSPNNPIITHSLEDPYLVLHNSQFYLYAEDKENVDLVRLYISSDFVEWVGQGIVLRPVGEDGTWESHDVSSPVVWIVDSIWYMLYEGRDRGDANGIGLVTSQDGGIYHPWERTQTAPVLSREQTYDRWTLDNGDLVPDDIVQYNGYYYMTYHGYRDQDERSKWYSGIAKSKGFLNWEDYSNNPFSDNTGESSSPQILFDGNEYVFFYYLGDDSGIFRGYPTKVYYSLW